MLNRMDFDDFKSLLLLISLIITLLISLFILSFLYSYASLESYIESGYSVYIDGNLVDSTKISIRNYSRSRIEVNDELCEIYINSF